MNYIYCEQPIESAANSVAKSIIRHLSKGERVLWLLTGGSGVPIAQKASRLIRGYDLSNLTVSLTDERFGSLGHDNENWKQIIESGFSLPGATLYRPLNGKTREKTTDDFNEWIKKQLIKNDYKIGLFGIGTDGHTAGIKPKSEAITSKNYVTSFAGEDFERITITFPTIKKIDEAIIQATGTNKKQIIKNLLANEKDKKVQPAQILNRVKTSTLFSNNKREEL